MSLEHTQHNDGISSISPDIVNQRYQEALGMEGLLPLTEGDSGNFFYKGTSIEGIDVLVSKGILKGEDVIGLLDRLPEAYFTKIPLTAIKFSKTKLFSIERRQRLKKKILFVSEEELQPRDKIIARKRGVTNWNHTFIDGVPYNTDGGSTIEISSPENWDNQHDPIVDKSVALYTLAHELGQTLWRYILEGTEMMKYMTTAGFPQPQERDLSYLQSFITDWKNLPKSTLPRYQEYKNVFLRENKRDTGGYTPISDEDLSYEEDFAIAHEYYLYWQNLAEQDPARNRLLDALYEALAR